MLHNIGVVMSLESLSDIILALSLIAALVIFISANVNYLPEKEKKDE